MNSDWKNLWLECAAARDFEGFEELCIVPDIVSLGNSMCLEVSEEDVNELVDDHRTELTTEELHHLYQRQQKEVAEEISSGEEEGDAGNKHRQSLRNGTLIKPLLTRVLTCSITSLITLEEFKIWPQSNHFGTLVLKRYHDQ